jgi:hypothetical protein
MSRGIFRNRFNGFRESRRDSVLQPRVGVFQPTLGKRKSKEPTPTGCVDNWAGAKIQIGTTLSGLQINFFSTQGWLKNANPGLED